MNGLLSGLQREINDYCVSKGAPELKSGRLHPVSPTLNIYLWPEELDYVELKPMPDNWIRVENFIRITNDTFELPEQLAKRAG